MQRRYYGFATRVYLELTDEKDTVTLKGLTTSMTINAKDGPDVFNMETNTKKSDFVWDGGAGDNVVHIAYPHLVAADITIVASNQGNTHMNYSAKDMVNVTNPGLVKFIGTGGAKDKLTFTGMQHMPNKHEFRQHTVHWRSSYSKRVVDQTTTTGTQLLDCGERAFCDQDNPETGACVHK